MLKTLESNFLKKTIIGLNTRSLWQWIDDTFN